MSLSLPQAPSLILMRTPENFGFNEQTAADNSFQRRVDNRQQDLIAARAMEQQLGLAVTLQEKGVEVLVFRGNPEAPDSIFLNNWFSTHGDLAIIYPMKHENRRLEYHEGVIAAFEEHFGPENVLDLRGALKAEVNGEAHALILEATGSMNLDYANHMIHAALSERTDPSLLHHVAFHLGIKELYPFESTTANGEIIYHTNIMEAIMTHHLSVCMESIEDDTQRQSIQDYANKTGKTLIDLTQEEVNHFAGNMIEVSNAKGARFLVVSHRGWEALAGAKKDVLRKEYGESGLVTPEYDAVEINGGSVRCSIAGLFPSPEKGAADLKACMQNHCKDLVDPAAVLAEMQAQSQSTQRSFG